MSLFSVYITFGGNSGDVKSAILEAHTELTKKLCINGSSNSRLSSLYRTKPLVLPGHDASKLQDYINCAGLYLTKESPRVCLETCLAFELKLGRVRDMQNRYASRKLDLDIALYDTKIIEEDILTIPHPRFHTRDFALVPIIELTPNIVHPILKMTLEECLIGVKEKFIIEPRKSSCNF